MNTKIQIATVVLRTTLAATCAFATSVPAFAAYFPGADINAARSMSSGMSVPFARILRRAPRNSPETEITLLSAALPMANRGAATLQKRTDRLRLTAQTWQLDVFGDGSGAEFIDRAAESRAHALRISPANAPSFAQLEAAGRRFIARGLSRVIVLQRGERLVPEAASSRIDTEVRADGTSRRDAVVANRVVFTREIDGLPVVGSGSKVTVTFLNDGSVESFRYDWPAYVRTSQIASVAAAHEIVSRVTRVIGVRAGTTSGMPIHLPQSAAAVRPLAIARNTQLERLACGYYDPGYANRDAHAPVQPGCYYHVVQYRGEGAMVTSAAYSGAVPAARIAESDLYWPEAALLQNMKRSGLPAPRSARSGNTIEAVPAKPH